MLFHGLFSNFMPIVDRGAFYFQENWKALFYGDFGGFLINIV
jgi:hypothetical protein